MRKLASFEILIYYSQFDVRDIRGENDLCISDLNAQHFGQGFAWAPGIVTFMTVGECSSAYIEVCTATTINLEPTSTRAIVLPFSVSASGVKVVPFMSNPTEEIQVPIPTGNYALLFELKLRDDNEYFEGSRYLTDLNTSQQSVWCRLTFIPQEHTEPEILRSDDEMSDPGSPLLMEAEIIATGMNSEDIAIAW
jgi:hypothetical protein